MEPNAETPDFAGFYQKMQERLDADPSYGQRLQTDFRGCAAELGWIVPTDHVYQAFIDTPTIHHLVIHKCPTVHSSKVRF